MRYYYIQVPVVGYWPRLWARLTGRYQGVYHAAYIPNRVGQFVYHRQSGHDVVS